MALPAFFSPPEAAIHIWPLALAGQPCEAWKPIINGRDRLSKFWAAVLKDSGTIVEKCEHLDAAYADLIANPQKYIRPGEAMAVLDPSRPECGSDEARSAGERRYLILCSPNHDTFNALSWMHEGWHISLGHTALRHTAVGVIYALPEPLSSSANVALKTFLDIAYVEPAMVLGKQAAAWLRMMAFIGWLLLILRRWLAARIGFPR